MALDFLAGCVGGCAGVAVGYPLDTVKVRLQTQDARHPTYRGTFHCLQTIVQQESVRGLFKGMSSPMASVAVINAMIFGVYGNVQRRLSEPESLRSHALAGSVAGLVQSFVCSPMELVKTRIQIQEQVCTNGVQLYKGPVDCVRQIWQAEGVRGIFRGLNITIAREIPAFGLYFASYEAMTRRKDPSKPLGTFHMMMAGGAAGIVSWLFTYPIDFLKSRLQVDGLAGQRIYKGVGDCIMKTYQNEGFHGFFRGMPTTLIRSFPVNAVTFSVVTWMLRWCEPSAESSSVTYQDASSLQVPESLVNTASFAHDYHHVTNRMPQNEWLAEWKPLMPMLTLGQVSLAFPSRNYAVHCGCNDWLGGAVSSLVHLSQVHNIGAAANSRPSSTNAASVTVDKRAGPSDNCRCREAEEEKKRQPIHITGDSTYASAAAAAVAVCSAVCCPTVDELA
ncbi:hypothetical protein GHT06_009068 [Daphnia sinensis]|uniref:Mitochondrial basic amino acids transporter n=1 Tax=Daphnia sinensis TaxID=1820382 RepID=A0AAD5LN21_9CRUS|nr:hypothetical protein GHT06_009068 [Daphnia sinensis]